ncbi:hypothetical protein ACE1ET_15350 [Saccharicrinis sp. FJH62]|uniref:hypothetical protein n=1 Tax=Saccharicrinis sp. FJH62 TaxID=3344657 RepID=UPI0035D3FCD0
MFFVKKIVFFVLSAIVMSSCHNKLPVDSNSHIINRIDSMSFTDTVYEVTFNAEDIIQDTISIRYIKENDSGQVVFERLESLHPNFYSVNESYYKDGRLVLRNAQLNGQPYSKYENFFDKDTLLIRSDMINFDSGRNDTFIIRYNYTYFPDGTNKTIKSFTEGDTTDTYQLTRYNEKGKAVSGIFVLKGDTVQDMTYFYDNGKLKKSVLEFIGSNRKEVHNFNRDEKEVLREYYALINNKPVLTKEKSWEYDRDGILLSSETKYMDNRKPELRRYIKTSD